MDARAGEILNILRHFCTCEKGPSGFLLALSYGHFTWFFLLFSSEDIFSVSCKTYFWKNAKRMIVRRWVKRADGGIYQTTGSVKEGAS